MNRAVIPSASLQGAAGPSWVRRCRLGLAVLLSCLWAAVHAGTVQVAVLDASGQPLADAVVFLDSAQARQQVKPLADIEMAQKKKQFVPGVLVVPVGSTVRFPNQDAVRHHVYSFSPAKKFELKLYAGTPSNAVVFDQPGVVTLGCNIHDLMVGWILVVETPYFARTSATGTVQLDNVPPGRYTLRAWHSRLPVGAPALEQALTVSANAPGTASVRMAELLP